MSSAIRTAAIVPRMEDAEAPSLNCYNKNPNRTSPFPFPGLPMANFHNFPRVPPPPFGGAVSNGMNCQRLRATPRFLYPCVPESPPSEPIPLRPPLLLASCAPPPALHALVPPVHGTLSSDLSRPTGTIHPPMKGLLPAHPFLDAALAGLVGLARQRNPFWVTSQGLETQFPPMQGHLHPPVEPRLCNGRHPSSPLPTTIGLRLLPKGSLFGASLSYGGMLTGVFASLAVRVASAPGPFLLPPPP